MSDIVLHHYELSPYCEKVRRILAFKGLDWASREVPMVLPRPELMELTGGYRRTPVLQIGADLYCDTKAQVAAIERLHPEPPLVREEQRAAVLGLAHWGESAFPMVVALYFGQGLFPREFLEDRKAMMPRGTDAGGAALLVPSKMLQLAAHLDAMERQLAAGGRYLLGDEPTLADFAAFHPLLFLSRHPRGGELLERAPAVQAWRQRVAAIEGGRRSELAEGEALEVARRAEPAPIAGEPSPLPKGVVLGAQVLVVSEERGSGDVGGQLVGCSTEEIVVRRESERAGALHVHFPRVGYLVLPAS